MSEPLPNSLTPLNAQSRPKMPIPVVNSAPVSPQMQQVPAQVIMPSAPPTPPKQKKKGAFFWLFITISILIIIIIAAGTYIYIKFSRLLSETAATQNADSPVVSVPLASSTISTITGYIVSDTYDNSGKNVAYYDIRFYSDANPISPLIAVPLNLIASTTDGKTVNITDQSNYWAIATIPLSEDVIDPNDKPTGSSLAEGSICLDSGPDGAPQVFACDPNSKLNINTSDYDSTGGQATTTSTSSAAI
jgi:hypothetical protein